MCQIVYTCSGVYLGRALEVSESEMLSDGLLFCRINFQHFDFLSGVQCVSYELSINLRFCHLAIEVVTVFCLHSTINCFNKSPNLFSVSAAGRLFSLRRIFGLPCRVAGFKAYFS